MSRYKRVSFYDLCRLCASNTQKDKTHIFLEEGRKIQLQTKIETCLALTVKENDFLPKVVCSKCLQTLESCYGFRQECIRSESMLSTYFKNARSTADFKKSGKVYIKDIKPMSPSSNQDNTEVLTTTSTTILSTSQTSQNIIQISKNHQPVEASPLYALGLPVVIPGSNAVTKNTKEVIETSKISQGPSSNNLTAYNLNVLNTTTIKSSVKTDVLSNVVVNSNGEVINISNLGDFETILSQGTSSAKYKQSKLKNEKDSVNLAQTEEVYKNVDVKNEKLPHIKSTQSSKFSYTKIDEEKSANPSVIYPNTEYNQNFNNTAYTQSSQTSQQATNVICNNLDSNIIKTEDATLNGSNQTMMQQTQFPRSVNINNKKPPSEADQKPHICEYCGRTFKRREHLYQHTKLHTGFRPYRCEHCNKAFMRKEHLIRHSTLHSGQKNYTCNVCEKSFSRNDNLLKHKKTHEKQATYTCEICQKQFVMKHYYDAHKLTHGDKCLVSTVWNMLKT